MKVIRYETGEETLYDFHTLKQILGFNKSKLYRELKKIDDKEKVRYRNQYLFKETTLFKLMENRLIEEVSKIESVEYGL